MNKIKVYSLKISGLDNDALFDRAMSRVSPWRREKAEKLCVRQKKNQSLGAGLLLDYVLDSMGAGQPEIRENEYGKPYIPDRDLYFNLSHSGDYAICAAGYAPVGCDIQKIRKIDKTVAQRCFSREEFDYIVSRGGGDRLICKMWSLKESYVKAVGTGLADTPGFCIDISGGTPALHNKPYHFRQFEFEDYVCAVCSTFEATENITEIKPDDIL